MSLLEKQLDRFKMEQIRLLDVVSDSIALIDRLGNIAFMNKAFKNNFNKGVDIIQIPIQKIFFGVNLSFNEKADKLWTVEGTHEGNLLQFVLVKVEKNDSVTGFWVIARERGFNEVKNGWRGKLETFGLGGHDILDSITDAIGVLDANRYFVSVNRAFASVLGLSKKDLLGKNSSFFIKGLEKYQSDDKKEIKVEITNAQSGYEFLDVLVYPGTISEDNQTVIIIKAAELSRALQYKVKLLNSKLAYYQEQLEKATSERYKLDNIISKSEQMKALKESIKKMACSNCTVLLRGEKGVGKELLARAMHAEGPRKLGPFIKIKCSEIVSEGGKLFSTDSDKLGSTRKKYISTFNRLIMADKGTVYFEEIDDLPLSMQRELLGFVQSKTVQFEEGKQRKLDVRVIVATSGKLEELVKKNQFSERLYYRLNVLSFHIPPLRDRKEDISPLAEHFLKQYGTYGFSTFKASLTKEFLEALHKYDWPGNVQELKTAIEISANATEEQVLSRDALPLYLRKIGSEKSENMGKRKLKDVLDETEKVILLEALQKTAGNKVKAAKILGISRAGLYQKLEKHSLLDE